MSSVIRRETAVFLLFILHGAALICLYDILRALRRSIRHSLAVLSAEDFLFWLLAGFLTFYLSFRETDGILRGYIAAGILLGAVLCHFTLSPILVKALTCFFTLIQKAVCFPFRVFSTAVQKLMWFFCKKRQKRIEITRKRVYNRKLRRKGRKPR